MVHHIKTGKYIANFRILNMNEYNNNHHLYNSRGKVTNMIEEEKGVSDMNTTIFLKDDE